MNSEKLPKSRSGSVLTSFRRIAPRVTQQKREQRESSAPHIKSSTLFTLHAPLPPLRRIKSDKLEEQRSVAREKSKKQEAVALRKLREERTVVAMQWSVVREKR